MSGLKYGSNKVKEMDKKRISVIIPAYNEEDNVAVLAEKLVGILKDFVQYEVIFIDDGSNDNTLQILKRLHEEDGNVNFISFSRNFGHQNALKAGFDFANGDCVISMDADLQHPPELIPKMIESWLKGYDIIYTIREGNKSLPFLKRKTASIFYKIINLISDIKISEGAADFRLLDKAVVDVLKGINESSPFYRGLVSWSGFKQYGLKFTARRRYSGVSKYSLRKMIQFALRGITSFSVAPLRLATYIGFIMAVSGFVFGLKAILEYFFTNRTVPGWTSTIVAVVFVGGVQLIMLGIIGEYLGKLFIESKKRPNYIVRESSMPKPVI
jgi:dolichol-phosphate mannosyltransferase